MDPHFLTITTTKTREMSFNDSGGMVYLKDAFDQNGVIENPTYHGEMRFIGSGSDYDGTTMFFAGITVAIDKGDGNGPQWVPVVLSTAQGVPDDGLPFYA